MCSSDGMDGPTRVHPSIQPTNQPSTLSAQHFVFCYKKIFIFYSFYCPCFNVVRHLFEKRTVVSHVLTKLRRRPPFTTFPRSTPRVCARSVPRYVRTICVRWLAGPRPHAYENTIQSVDASAAAVPTAGTAAPGSDSPTTGNAGGGATTGPPTSTGSVSAASPNLSHNTAHARTHARTQAHSQPEEDSSPTITSTSAKVQRMDGMDDA